jgi:hypothetical protein
MTLNKLIIFLLIGFSTPVLAKTSKNCFFNGADVISPRCRSIEGLSITALKHAVADACNDICNQGAREEVYSESENLKNDLQTKCTDDNPCSTDTIGIVHDCANSAGRAVYLMKQIEEESKQPKECKPTEPAVS